MTVVGEPDADPPSAAECARRLAERSGGLAVVTSGASGAWACDGERLRHLASEPVDPAYPIGSGDAFVAGLVAGRLRRGRTRSQPDEVLVDGTAASRVNLRSLVAGQVGVAEWEAERDALSGDP